MENNYLSLNQVNSFIQEYKNATTLDEKLAILQKYSKQSSSNDEVFTKLCKVDPVECNKIVEDANLGFNKFSEENLNITEPNLYPLYNSILVSERFAAINSEWNAVQWHSIIPDRYNIKPNQELANKLAKGISDGTIPLSKKSADLLYKLNMDPGLEVDYDPSSIIVSQGDESNTRKNI